MIRTTNGREGRRTAVPCGPDVHIDSLSHLCLDPPPDLCRHHLCPDRCLDPCRIALAAGLVRTLTHVANEKSPGKPGSTSFSPDSSMVAYASSDGRVRIVKTDDWTLQQTFSNHRDKSLKSTRFSPDGKYLAYSGGSQSCLVRRVSDWTVVADLVHKGNMKALPGDDNDRDVKVEKRGDRLHPHLSSG